jgi:membrane protease YdiL (CAAX protease family)
VVTFVVVAYLGTWLAISPLVLGPNGLGVLPYPVPDALGVLIFFGASFTGPTLAAFVASWREGGRAGVRRFAAGYRRWRVGLRWWLLAPVLFPALWLAGYSLALGGAPLVRLLQDPQVLLTVFLPALLLIHLLPALGEEAGWRGYALPRLERTLRPPAASLVLGLIHGFWHLPLFFVVGLLGPFSASGFGTFLAVGICATVVYTWVSNNARHSIPIATLLHAGSNAATNLLGALLDLPYVGDARVAWLLEENRLNLLIFGTAAAVLLVATRGRLGLPAAGAATVDHHPRPVPRPEAAQKAEN